MSDDPEKMPCGWCFATGSAHPFTPVNDSRWTAARCPVCHGSGEHPIPPARTQPDQGVAVTKPSKADKKARRRKVRDRQSQIAGDVTTAVFGSAPLYRVHSVEEREDGSLKVSFDGASEFVVFGPDEARGLQVSPGDKIQVMALVTRVVEKPATSGFNVTFTSGSIHQLPDPD